jgi:chemosensory pili system protein ChpC
MATREEIYAVLISLKDDTMLLPNAAVAEVVGQEGLKPSTGGPVWLVGHAAWNGRRVPVISFEALNGGSIPELGRRSRLIVTHTLTSDLDVGHVALLSQGYPHLITLNRNAMQKVAGRESDRTELVLSRIKIANHDTLLPDMEAIESEMLRAGVIKKAAAA